MNKRNWREPAHRYFFVSYARKDIGKVRAFLNRDKRREHRFWIDQQNLLPGARWSGSLVKAIRNCTALIVFCSRRSMQSNDVYREVAAAARLDKPIIPVMLEDVTIPDDFLFYLSIHEIVHADQEGGAKAFQVALDLWNAKADEALAAAIETSGRKESLRTRPARPMRTFMLSFCTSALLLCAMTAMTITGGIPTRTEVASGWSHIRTMVEPLIRNE